MSFDSIGSRSSCILNFVFFLLLPSCPSFFKSILTPVVFQVCLNFFKQPKLVTASFPLAPGHFVSPFFEHSHFDKATKLHILFLKNKLTFFPRQLFCSTACKIVKKASQKQPLTITDIPPFKGHSISSSMHFHLNEKKFSTG